MRGTRALLALVIVMTVLIVIGTTALVVVIVHRLTHPGVIAEAIEAPAAPMVKTALAVIAKTPVAVIAETPAAVIAETPAAPVAALAQEPPGTRVTALARQSDTWLAIALSGGGPDRILVWDLPNGRPVTEIRLGP